MHTIGSSQCEKKYDNKDWNRRDLSRKTKVMLNITGSFWSFKTLQRGGVSLLLLLPLGVVIHGYPSCGAVSAAHHVVDRRITGGSLVMAGGGHVSSEVRQRFLELAGGENARIVVIPATDPAAGTEESWLAPWRELGVTHIELCHAPDRATANTARFCAALGQATGVWFSGGYQDVLASRYVDTAVQTSLHEVLSRNGVVGGCSAGAAILSRVMIQEGENLPIEARGFDLISNAVVDQHFLQRNRLWRLQQMLETHPNLLGLGIDEKTALVYECRTERLQVVGDSYAMVCIPSTGANPARIEVLHAGDNILLEQLRTSHLAYQPPVKPGDSPVRSVVHAD